MSFSIGDRKLSLEDWSRRNTERIRDEIRSTPKWRVVRRWLLTRRLKRGVREEQIFTELAKAMIATQPAPRKWFRLNG